MLSLVVLNLCNSSSCDSSKEVFDRLSSSSLTLKTCLRQMIIMDEADFDESFSGDFQAYKGYDALDYAVKVMSGLESPVLGETEIFGQFKKQILPQLEDQKNKKFRQPVQFILAMVKRIRTKHFVGQGAQTYGGLVRKILKSEDNALFIGAGSFAESIYPWVKPHKNIFFSVRDPKKYKEHDTFKEDIFFSLSERLPLTESISVIVCAPMKASDIEKHLESSSVTTIVDLRENSDSDPIKTQAVDVYTLGEVFKEISKNLDRKREIKEYVELDIKEHLNKKLEKIRPIGWDESCTSN